MIEHFNVINIESYYDSLLLTFRNKLRKKNSDFLKYLFNDSRLVSYSSTVHILLLSRKLSAFLLS